MITQKTAITPPRCGRSWRVALIALLIALRSAWAEPPALPVAHLTLLVGAAQAHRPKETEPRPLTEGAPLYEGDEITVAPDAYAIVRFLDDARLALRPGTTLAIRRYRADGAQHLELRTGSIRHITGHGAHEDPHRFRLATPIAAIGVQGTDFSVNATQPDATLVQLHRGAIVVAPLNRCADTLLTTCADAKTIDVPGDLWRITPSGIAPLVVSAPAAVAKPPQPAVPLTSQAAPLAPAVERPAVATLPAAHPLVWSRFPLPGAAIPGDPFTQPLEEARSGRHIAFTHGAYGLWRQGAELLDPALSGTATFTLTAAAAGLTTHHYLPPQPATLTEARLTVDFDRRAATLAHTLTAPSLPAPYHFSATLPLGADGLFRFATAQDQITGALTANGAAAAYGFTHHTPSGRLDGITQWQR